MKPIGQRECVVSERVSETENENNVSFFTFSYSSSKTVVVPKSSAHTVHSVSRGLPASGRRIQIFSLKKIGGARSVA